MAWTVIAFFATFIAGACVGLFLFALCCAASEK